MREQRSQLEGGLHLALVCNQQEDGLLELRHSGVSLHTLHNAHRQSWRNVITSSEPRMLQTLRRIGSPCVVLLEHLHQEVSAQATDSSEALVVLHLFVADFLDGRLLPPSLVLAGGRWPLGDEGEVASAHVVQDDSGAPHVHLDGHLLAEDLRCHVKQCSADIRSVLLFFVEQLRQTEVDDLDGGAFLVHHHDILRLQVFVKERHGVHEGQGAQRLFHDVAHEGLVVRRLARLSQHVHLFLKLSAIAGLHDLRDILAVIKVLVHLDDIGMIQHGHVANLLQDLLARHV
mmetsp:Transcript_6211/g.14201  ORF Transcript_6211/g.14201 Transcript_6211/m.14201 type:complete len:288 (-) Transcript_6211:1137-2000(-)